MSTTVIFRKWIGSDDVIALFPEVPANFQGTLCTCYAPIGQHGAADYGVVIGSTRPADEHEYGDLMEELQAIGYEDLEVRLRLSREMVAKRLERVRVGS